MNEENQYEQEKNRVKSLGRKAIVAVFIIAAFLIGMVYGNKGYSFDTSGQSGGFIVKNQNKGPRDVDWQVLWDAIEKIQDRYVDNPIDMQNVLYGAVAGAVSSLGDPYSVFLPPKEAESFQEELRGEFEGIGAEIAVKGNRLTVVSPLDGSPAKRAGIRAGDFIYKVDGEETADFTIEEAVSKIRGEAGTKVVLTVVHKNDNETIDISVTRDKIEVKSVEWEIKEKGGKRIGYLKMRRFGIESQGLIDQAISNFLLNNVSGVIVDVRNNPGGYLDTAVDVASNWVAQGLPVVTQKFGDGSEDVFKATGSPRLNGVSTVIMINGGSASASEILAGALKDYNLATVLGEQSFGKGSVQELIDLQDGADLKLTIAKWLTPEGHDLNKSGIEPDLVVELTEEDFANDVDPQLEKALEVLSVEALDK